MEIKGLATAVIFWLILNNFLPWLRLLIMTLTTHSDAGMHDTLTASVFSPFLSLLAATSQSVHVYVILLLCNEYVDMMYVFAAQSTFFIPTSICGFHILWLQFPKLLDLKFVTFSFDCAHAGIYSILLYANHTAVFYIPLYAGIPAFPP